MLFRLSLFNTPSPTRFRAGAFFAHLINKASGFP
nr:MAG TPA: hypothetical protein [Caudoviricetes sp.]